MFSFQGTLHSKSSLHRALRIYLIGLVIATSAIVNGDHDHANSTKYMQSRQVTTNPHVDESVLYIIKTSHSGFETRLRAVEQTWGSLLDDAHKLIVGDVDYCGDDQYDGLSCRLVHTLALALEHSNWSWVLLVDDDHYIKPERFAQALATYDASRNIGVGVWGCGFPWHCNGLKVACGGTVYGFSRPAFKAMVTSVEFRNLTRAKGYEFRRIAGSPDEDVLFSCLARRTIPSLTIQALTSHGSVSDLALSGHPGLSSKYMSSDQVLGVHHVSPDRMLEAHRLLFLNAPHSLGAIASEM